jgi:hypothetical protein
MHRILMQEPAGKLTLGKLQNEIDSTKMDIRYW